jgi:hypothetical protein
MKLQCVRCTRRQADVERAHLFLCGNCEPQFQAQAFNGTPPLYSANSVDGFCEFCDEKLPLRHTEWLLCSYCARVVQSYRLGKVTAEFALKQLNALHLKPAYQFQEADPVLIQANTARGGRRKPATKLDLEAVDPSTGQRHFWIELKTGPGSIDEIPEFQLDTTDCDDIQNAVLTSGVPALLIHCQVEKQPSPPTMRLTPQGLWWTDLGAFAGSFIKAAPRRGNERKNAASFAPNCFQRIDTLAGFLAGGGIAKLAADLRAQGCAPLYKR